MSDNTKTSGISFTGLLTIVFIVLKLTEYIDWSWWWVLSPLWLPLCIVLTIFAVIPLSVVLIGAVVNLFKRSK